MQNPKHNILPRFNFSRFVVPLLFTTKFLIHLFVFETMAKGSFKLKHPLERRMADIAHIRGRYPDRIPVVVEKDERSDIPDIDRTKYIVPADLTIDRFVRLFRIRIDVSAEKAIFVFANNTLIPTGALMSDIYEENKDEDGFLYMTYSGENTLAQV